ncbi:MAG TPA: hypothetical protein VFZ65_15705 [Planctomycetota bacterium]|nr:hypothetical protein [Planctomycetota bacterium]
MPSSRWSLGLLALVSVHVCWGLARVPTKVLARRLTYIEAFRRDGDAAFLFGDARIQGADAVLWLREHTANDSVLLWRGTETGPIEFAAALLWPRLLVAAGAVDGATSFAGRSFATGTIAGRTGRIVLVAERAALHVEVP